MADVKQYFHPQAYPDSQGSSEKMIDWKLSEDDVPASLVVLDGKSPENLPGLSTKMINVDMFGQGAHGNKAGEGASEDGRVGSDQTDFDGPKPPMNLLAGDEEVNAFFQSSRELGQKLAIRDEAIIRGSTSQVNESSKENMKISKVAADDVSTKVSSSDPTLASQRSGVGSEVPDVKHSK